MIPVTRLFSLRGDCMLPLLEPGDEVWVRPGPVSRTAAGGLVAFARLKERTPEIVVHRLLDHAGPVTRADALTRLDDAGDMAALVGSVDAFRRGRRVVVFGTPRARAYDAFARFWARLAIAPLLYSAPYPFLRPALLAAPRALFVALFGFP